MFKERLGLALSSSGAVRTVAYDTVEIGDLVSELQSIGPLVMVLESAGVLELPLASALAVAPLPVANPSQVRHFAKPAGIFAKTDVLGF